MLKLKEELLKYDFIDCPDLDEYVELMLNNYGTALKKGSTQKHHVIPVSCYFKDSFDFSSHRKEALQLAADDQYNYTVNLNYCDHIKAHYLLCRSSNNVIQIMHNAKACELMLRTLQPAVDNNIVFDITTPDAQQTAYEYIRSITPQSSGSFKPREGTYASSSKKRHKANTKIRCVETGVIYDSMRAAEIANGLAKSRLNSILTGHRKQIPGMTFEYYDETSEVSE